MEPVWHEHLVPVVFVAGGENVGALNSLINVAEDIKHGDNTLGGIGRTSNVSMNV
jgi:hypothetical protein